VTETFASSLAEAFATLRPGWVTMDAAALKWVNGKTDAPSKAKHNGDMSRHAGPGEWERVLRGEMVLGLVFDDGEVTQIGAVDLDDYTINHVTALADVRRLDLPLSVFSTKSDGLRLFLHTTAPVTVPEMREAVRACGRLLGWVEKEESGSPGQFEVFPKLSGGWGSCLWMPFCGKKFRPLHGHNVAMTEDQFLDHWAATALTPDQLAALAARTPAQTPEVRAEAQPQRALEAIREMLGELATLAKGEGRNQRLYFVARRAGEMVHYGHLERADVEAMLRDVFDKWPDDDREHSENTLRRGLEKGTREPGVDVVDGRPVVRLSGGSLARSVDEAEAILVELDADLYQRGDFVVRPAWVPVPVADEREALGLRLLTVRQNHMTERFSRVADFQRYDGRSRKWVSVDPPPNIAATYLERVGAWKLPVLTGVTNAPTLRPDGSVLDEPGYDPATGILYEPGGREFPPVPAEPTRDDALAALGVLREPLSEFPFVGEGSRAVALSAILTAMIRRSLPHAPLHGFTSPTAGSGKSKLVDLASVVATGHEAPVIAPGATEEEMEKRLGASLLAGDTMVSFDNCEGPVGGVLLCQAMTQTMLSIRVLGKSVMVQVPNKAVLCATGNNLVIAADLTRRSIAARLDPKIERPELRTFENPLDPVERIKRDRPRHVLAALTVLRAYVVAGRPAPLAPLGSFEEWSRWVREALVWLGEDDPCDTMEGLREADPVLGELVAVMHQWEEHVGRHKEATTATMIELATKRSDLDVFKNPQFRDALLTVAGAGSAVSPLRLGKWMAKVKDRVVGDRRFVRAGMTDGAARWRLERLGRDRGGLPDGEGG